MSLRARATTIAWAALLAGACASVPRDSGFADVRSTIVAETKQPLEWDPSRPVAPPDDASLGSLLAEPLTVERAVEVAFAHNRDVQATLEELGIARGDLIAASSVRNPLAHGELRFPPNPIRPFEVGLTKSLLDLLQLGSRKKLGRAQFEAAQVRVTAAILGFASEVRGSYYELLAARQVLVRRGTLLRAQQAAAELAGRQHQAGNISDLDLENEQARYGQVKLDQARAELDELEARERLIARLGLQGRAELQLPDAFPEAPASEESEEDIVAQLPARRLDLRIAEREIEAAQRSLGIAGKALLEGATLGAHYEREPQGPHTTGPSLEVPIPLFDRGAAQKTRARAQLRQALQRHAALLATARSEARAVRERVLEARARAAYLREVVIPRRDRILKLTQLEYNAMLKGPFQLIEARQGLASAERDEILATRDYWIARTQLDATLLGVSQFSVRREAKEAR